MSSTQRGSLSRARISSQSVGALAFGAIAGAFFVATALPDPDPVVIADPITQPMAEVVPEIVEPFDFGDCPPTARACVDLDGERAWLQDNGELTYGAVNIGQGGPGYETPRSSFTVSRKVIDDVSYVFDLAPMPYAVYFTSVGHAFHEGDPSGDSHGCVRLAPGEAEIFFNELQIGDMIHIY